jgi:type 1 glutamine amidotransferase
MRTTVSPWFLAFLLVSTCCSDVAKGQLSGQEPDNKGVAHAGKRKIVLIAGPKSHGPVGNGMHDYGWSVCLLRVMLEHSNVKDQIEVEHFLDGWPKDSTALDDADTLMIVSDGRDGDKFEDALHLAGDVRVGYVDGLMKKGCGLVTFHFSTFAPEKYADKVLDWNGGYFKWETNGKRDWYSAIKTQEAEVQIASPDHPVARGIEPFKMREEFYYNIKFDDKVDPIKPIWVVPALKGRDPDGNVVAWVREREGGGRGFGTTCGHFYDNWEKPPFRKLILNAIVWTAKVEVPKEGVEARYYTHDEIRDALGPKHVPVATAESIPAKTGSTNNQK